MILESVLCPVFLIVIRLDHVTPVCLKQCAVWVCGFLDLFLLLSHNFSTCLTVPKGSHLYLLSCLTISPNSLSTSGS